jgi:hypothetical protein
MTRYTKLAISLPLRAAENVRRAVRAGRAESASAYIAAAIEEKASHEDLGALLEEMLAETGGPMTAAERRWAERTLGIGAGARRPSAQRRRRRRR